MSLTDHPVTLFFVLFATLLMVVELGYRLGLFTSANSDEENHAQIVAARDGIGVLLSLLLGFMLPMALPRYDLRKHLIIDEANAIGTPSPALIRIAPDPQPEAAAPPITRTAVNTCLTQDPIPCPTDFIWRFSN